MDGQVWQRAGKAHGIGAGHQQGIETTFGHGPRRGLGREQRVAADLETE
jgi:hypothetical protein